MQTTILIIHTLVALAIIILVLVQRGKGAEAGAAFGAGASGTTNSPLHDGQATAWPENSDPTFNSWPQCGHVQVNSDICW